MCTLALVALARGETSDALRLALRGFKRKPSSWRCRKAMGFARKALAS